jgi:protein SCO1/2
MTTANIKPEHLQNPPLSPFTKGGISYTQFLIPHHLKALPLFEKEGLGEICPRSRKPPTRTAPVGLLTLRVALPTLTLALALISAHPSIAVAHDDQKPVALREVAFDQKLDQPVPLELLFRDESGKTVRLADYFKEKPMILSFVYLKCRDLCPLLLDGVVRTLRALSFDVGNQFNVLTVSFDPHDSPALAAAKKSDIVAQYARPGASAGWHFLTGDETSIRTLAQSVGFHYTYDAKTGEFGHATGIVLLTPNGKTARYYYGIDFSPRDLRFGLIEAAADKIGSPIDQLLLFCYHSDPASGKYGLLITRLIRLAAVATVLILGAFILAMLRRERANASRQEGTA